MHLSPVKPLPPRDTRGPTPVAQCGAVADLVARARELDHLNRRLRPHLPPVLAEHVTLAGLRNDRAYLLAPTPAWAARVRMEQSRTLAALRAAGIAAAAITVRVASTPAVIGDRKTAERMSHATAQRLRAAAASMTDPELRALFLELASCAGTQPSS